MGRAPTQTQRGMGGRGHGLAGRPDRVGSGGTEDEQAPRFCARISMIRLEVACGKCGIAKHPQEIEISGVVFNKCPTSGCHVCCRRGERGGGCTMQGGRAFFDKMMREIYPYDPSEKWVEDRWRSWRTQLGLS